MTRTRQLALWIASLVVAVGAGRMLASSSAPAAPAPPAVASSRPIVVAPAAAPGLTLDDVRAAVRAELAARGDAPTAAAPAAAPAQDDAPAGDPDALATALDVVAATSADGTWTDADRDRLRPLLARLSGPEREQVLRSLFPQINADRVHVEVHGPLL